MIRDRLLIKEGKDGSGGICQFITNSGSFRILIVLISLKIILLLQHQYVDIKIELEVFPTHIYIEN